MERLFGRARGLAHYQRRRLDFERMLVARYNSGAAYKGKDEEMFSREQEILWWKKTQPPPTMIPVPIASAAHFCPSVYTGGGGVVGGGWRVALFSRAPSRNAVEVVAAAVQSAAPPAKAAARGAASRADGPIRAAADRSPAAIAAGPLLLSARANIGVWGLQDEG